MRCLVLSYVCLWSASLLAADAEVHVSLSPARPIDAITIKEALTPVLSLAISGGKNAPSRIEQQLKSSLPKTGNDPRLHYVYALVLLKNFRHADAKKEMQTAADHALYFFPVHHFLIHEQIRNKEFENSVDSLLELSERLGDPGQFWTSEDERLEAAHWLGRMLAFLESPCGNEVAAQLAKRAEPLIRTQVGPAYESELDLGFNEVHAEHREMQMLLLAATDTAAQKKVEELKAADKKQQEIDATKKSIATSVREQAAIAEEQIRDLESKLGVLEKQYEVLSTAQERLQVSIAAVRLEIAQLPNYAFVSNNTIGKVKPGGLTQGELDRALTVKNLELNGYVIDLQVNAVKQKELLSQAGQFVSMRQQLVSKDSLAESKNNDDLRRMARWEQRLNSKKKKVSQLTDRRTTAVRTRIPQIASYDAFNPQEELADLQRALTGADVVAP